jgi:CheY-like chemotaxis protein
LNLQQAVGCKPGADWALSTGRDTPTCGTAREQSNVRCSIYCTQVSHEISGPTVLLVEDDLEARRMYAEWLTQAGFRVKQAHNGLQALEQALEAVPDIVVVDLKIPGIDGFELTRRLKQDPRTQGVPVLALTGYAAFTADPGRAQRAGCNAVLEKPCPPDDLETAIRSLISGERLQPHE